MTAVRIASQICSRWEPELRHIAVVQTLSLYCHESVSNNVFHGEAEPYCSSGVEWDCPSADGRIDYSQLTRSITINCDHLQVFVVYAHRTLLKFRDARPKSILYVQRIESEMVTRADPLVTDQSFRGLRTSQRHDGQEASRVESI
jgi:hypothetical protein